MNRPAAIPSIGAALAVRPRAQQRAEPSTGKATAPNLPSIPLHLIPTIRNNQLPTAELAERLKVSPAEIDAIRALGQYFGGDPLASSLVEVEHLGPGRVAV